MKMTKIKHFGLAAAAGIMMLVTGNVVAEPKVLAPGLTLAKSGTLVCAGYYTANRRARIRWIWRNLNETAAIRIDRMRFFDWKGTLVYDSNSGGIPSGLNDFLGVTNTLQAHQNDWYRSEDLVTQGVLPPAAAPNGHVQVYIDWSSDSKVIPLTGTTVRQNYDNVTGRLAARSSAECRRIKIK